MNLTPRQLLKQQANIARSHRHQSQVLAQQKESSRQQFSASLVRYDASVGLWLCRLEDESLVWAKSLSPTAGYGVGSVVSLYRPAQGMAIIKSL